MMSSTKRYIAEWQKALQSEIQHMKNYGSSKYSLHNGILISSHEGFVYFFETESALHVPIGSQVKISWGHKKAEGRILSSEGRNIIVSADQYLGEELQYASLHHDPWELIDQLIQRLDDIKKSKTKRLRIKKLMDPSMPAAHPGGKAKSPVHELILRSKYNPVTFVWGPPGTGKTYTLARTAANKYFKKLKVLVLSHSNQAVDVLMAEIASFSSRKSETKDGDILRYGTRSSSEAHAGGLFHSDRLIEKHHPDLADKKSQLMEEKRLLKSDLGRSFSKRDSEKLVEIETKLAAVLEKIRKKEIEYVKDAGIIGTTLARAAGDPAIYESPFDLVIVDEASMAYVPQAAFAASLGKRIIICGDFKQLPPIAASRSELAVKWLKEDIFHHSGAASAVGNGQMHPHLFLLKEQRRMHPDISAFTNKHVYHSLVTDFEGTAELREGISKLNPFKNMASIMVDSSEMGKYGVKDNNSGSRSNLLHLALSFQLIHEAYLDGARSIGYATPYRVQASLMEQFMEEVYSSEAAAADIIAATVHRFQGSERDIMVFDTVDSFPFEKAGMLMTGKDSERLINVAVTRTRGKFIQVGDIRFIKEKVYTGKTWRKLAEHQLKMDQAVTPSSIGRWIRNQHHALQWIHSRKTGKVENDLLQAKSAIIISLPATHALDEEWTKIVNGMTGKASVTLISDKRHETLKHAAFVQKDVPFPFISIDSSILWLGMPFCRHEGIRPPYIAVRFLSENIAGYVESQFL
ncbi:AAA family ATPase [Bacillus infantis]|uniref:AAA domain-containing protein n=1 Tax=Bacillus infantis TaxID=324767 RepID=UPI001CD5C262|nr:AAA domain-containing protein [Bacillus infantis]MCA1034767.1 AAA family ATPase [Bacillus infantis]